MAKQYRNVRFDTHTLSKLRVLAMEKETTVSALIRGAVSNFLSELPTVK